MASRRRVPALDREHAPDDDGLVARLSQDELNMRCRAARLLSDAADQIQEPEVAAMTRKKARQMANAMPYREFVAERDRLKAALSELPGTGVDALDLRRGMEGLIRELSEKNPYPRDIETVYAAELGMR